MNGEEFACNDLLLTMDFKNVQSETLFLSRSEFKHLCTHSDFFESQKGFHNLNNDVQIKITSPRPLVDLDFVKKSPNFAQ